MENSGTPIVTVQRLSVSEGQADAFWSRFEELDVLGLAAGAAGGELERAVVVQKGSTFLVITVWGSPAGIDQWVASPSRELVFGALDEYYDAPPSVERYVMRYAFESGAS